MALISQTKIDEDNFEPSTLVGWEIMFRMERDGNFFWRFGSVVGVSTDSSTNVLVRFGDLHTAEREGAGDVIIRGPLEKEPTAALLLPDLFDDGTKAPDVQQSCWFRIATKKDADSTDAAAYARSLAKFTANVEGGDLVRVAERPRGNCFFLVSARARKILDGEQPAMTMEAVDQPALIHPERRRIAAAVRTHAETILASVTPAASKDWGSCPRPRVLKTR